MNENSDTQRDGSHETTFICVHGLTPSDFEFEEAGVAGRHEATDLANHVFRYLQEEDYDVSGVATVVNEDVHESLIAARETAGDDRPNYVSPSNLNYGDVVVVNGDKRAITAFPDDAPMIEAGEVGWERVPVIGTPTVGHHAGVTNTAAIDRLTDETVEVQEVDD